MAEITAIPVVSSDSGGGGSDAVTAAIESSISEAREAGVAGFEEEAADSGSTEAVADTPEVVAAPVTAAETTVVADKPAEVTPPVDDLAIGPEKNAAGRENKIPHSRVTKMVAKAADEALAPVYTALGVTKDTYKPEILTERLGKVAEYEGRLTNYVQADRLIEGDPDQFIATLASVDARYAKFLKPASPATPEVIAPAADPMPQPDYDMGGGQMTYSVKGLQARDEWVARQTEARVLAAADKRLKPIEEHFKTADDRAKAAEHEKQLDAHINNTMADARTWEGFKENEDAILKVLVDDTARARATGTRQKHSIDSAYRLVMGPINQKRIENAEATARKKVLDEIAAAGGGSTSTVTAPTRAANSGASRSTEDIIREEMRKLG